MLVDTHAHLNLPEYDSDRNDVVKRAEQAGVVAVLDVATDIRSSRRSLEISGQFNEVYSAIGIHPHEAAKSEQADRMELKSLLENPRVLAVGEIGLDYHYDFSPRNVQKSLFEWQLRMARDMGFPVIVHVRKAMQDALAVIDQVAPSGWRGVFHCFGGDADDVEAVLERGFFISFTGVVTFGNFKHQDAVRAVPRDRLLLETDCPFMTPVPHRGKRNEPALLREILPVIADIKRIEPSALEEQTTQNARILLGIKD